MALNPFIFGNFEIATINTDKKHFFNGHTDKTDIGQHFYES